LKVWTLGSRAKKALAISAVFGVSTKSAKLDTAKGNKQISKSNNIEFKRCKDPASYPSRPIWWVGLPRQGLNTSNKEKRILPRRIVLGGFEDRNGFVRFAFKQKVVGAMGNKLIQKGEFREAED
jgi:hypothetical protein